MGFSVPMPKTPAHRCEFRMTVPNLCLETARATTEIALPTRVGTVTDPATGISVRRPIRPDSPGIGPHRGGISGYCISVPVALLPNGDDRWRDAVVVEPLDAQGEPIPDIRVDYTAINPRVPGAKQRTSSDDPLEYLISSYYIRPDTPLRSVRVSYPTAGKVVDPVFEFRDIGLPRWVAAGSVP